jgi:hypothetical protein
MMWIFAQRGRAELDDGNSKRSMTRTRRVSDSLLNPVINKGDLMTVRDVEINGDEYVRIAGREDVANVELKEFRRVRDTMKLPTVSNSIEKSHTNFEIVFRTR